MQFAANSGHVVFTHDLDFGAVLAHSQDRKPSVLQVRTDNIDPDLLAPSVLSALRQYASDLAAGALVTVDPNRLRVRILPLGR